MKLQVQSAQGLRPNQMWCGLAHGCLGSEASAAPWVIYIASQNEEEKPDAWLYL